MQSVPDYLDQSHFSHPGFYIYYGSAHVRRDSIVLEDGQPAVIRIVSETALWEWETMESTEDFHFFNPGVARVEIFEESLIYLIPQRQGATTLAYTSGAGAEYVLQVVVDMPEARYDFVLVDSATVSGYFLWQNDGGVVGDQWELEVFFAEVIATSNGEIYSAMLLVFPQDLQVRAHDGAPFDLVRRGDAWYACAAPQEPGEYMLTITATLPGADSPQTWKKHLLSPVPVVVTENTVAAINAATQAADIQSGCETVILLPPGHIPMDYNDTGPVRNTARPGHHPLQRHRRHVPNTRRQAGQCDNSFCLWKLLLYSERKYPMNNGLLPEYPSSNSFGVYTAVCSDEILTLENCVLDGGTERWQAYQGISVVGDRVAFQGVNTIRNFINVGWCVESIVGLRRRFQGITFETTTRRCSS